MAILLLICTRMRSIQTAVLVRKTQSELEVEQRATAVGDRRSWHKHHLETAEPLLVRGTQVFGDETARQ